MGEAAARIAQEEDEERQKLAPEKFIEFKKAEAKKEEAEAKLEEAQARLKEDPENQELQTAVQRLDKEVDLAYLKRKNILKEVEKIVRNKRTAAAAAAAEAAAAKAAEVEADVAKEAVEAPPPRSRSS